MDLQHKDQPVVIDSGANYMQNRRTLEFFVLAGILGIGIPVACLFGVRAGTKMAAMAYPNSTVLQNPVLDFKPPAP
jgi:hypothetical protein